MIYDDGWFRISGVNRCGKKSSHYFFKDEPIHVLSSGMYKEKVDYTKRQSNNSRKCKVCLNILTAYSNIGLENRCYA